MSPSAKKFFERSASRDVIPSTSFSASTVIDESATSWTWKSPSDPSSSGLDAYPAFCRLRSLNASVLTMTVPPFARSPMLTLSAAGFIATSTFGWSPGREDVVVGEVDLEPRDARQRAGRRADLGRKVGERREVVPEDRGLAREAVAGELHAVARVAGEADDDPFELLDRLGLGYVRGIADAEDRARRRPHNASEFPIPQRSQFGCRSTTPAASGSGASSAGCRMITIRARTSRPWLRE